MKIRVYYEDTDAGGIVYHTNFIKYCERARSEMVFNSNLDSFTPNRHFVVKNINASYIKPAFLGDMLEVISTPNSIKKASLVVNQKIYKIASLKKSIDEKELIFEADIKIAYLVDKKPAAMSSKMIEFFKNYK